MTGAGPGPTAGRPSGTAPPPAVAGRYRLGPALGTGGSAQVFRATDQVLGRDVALKLFPATLEADDRHRQQRELALLAELHHPNLVDLFDAGEDDGRLYLVMRLVDGESLAARIARGGPAPLEMATQLGAELAGALAHVHGHGVTHRDVKPANILLGERPMLGDFGIARAADAPQVTHTGFVIGTPAYMAPEQVRGETVGPPADVYALGLVLLETITGQRAFGGTGVETAMARLTRPPDIPALPAGLDALLHRMTDLDPAVRPPASAVAAELTAAGGRLDAAAAGGRLDDTTAAVSAPAAVPTPTRVGPPGTAATAAAAPFATRVAPTGGAGGAAGLLAGRRGALLAAAAVLAAVVLVVGLALAGTDTPAPTPAAPAPSSSAAASSTASAAPSRTSAASPSAAPAPVTSAPAAPAPRQDSGNAGGSGNGGNADPGGGNEPKTPKEQKPPKEQKDNGNG